jgi:hypothetical protein
MNLVNDSPITQPSENPVPGNNAGVDEDENTDEMPGLVDQEDEGSDDEADDDSDDELDDSDNDDEGSNRNRDLDDDDDASGSMALRRSSRVKGGIKKPSRFTMATKKLQDKTIESEELKRSLNKAKEDEIRLVFEELQAMEPVRKEEILKEYKAHITH